eukprot:jgi/Chrpa1/23308/Chrysochromulina_OHIO_Genome00024339-RA
MRYSKINGAAYSSQVAVLMKEIAIKLPACMLLYALECGGVLKAMHHGDPAASPIAVGAEGVWARFANVSALAAELRGSAGDAALASSALTQQCPSRFMSGERVLCPWFSKACAAQQPATLAMAESAGRFAASAQLPPRQLLRAERCLTLTCL